MQGEKGRERERETERERVTLAIPQNPTNYMQQTPSSLFPKEKTPNPAACIPLKP
jgi:hypothetical protein